MLPSFEMLVASCAVSVPGGGTIPFGGTTWIRLLLASYLV